ncbi:MAG: sialidase family protein [Sedimentisphaerales bacterium]
MILQKYVALTALTCLLISPLRGAAGGKQEPLKTIVYESGTQGYHTYRIPALVVTPAGTLMAFCEGRKTSRSDHGDIDLMLRRSRDAGQTWDRQRIVYEEGDTKKITIGNPCAAVDETTGVVWLAFCRDNDRVFITHSANEVAVTAKVGVTGIIRAARWSSTATITAKVGHAEALRKRA